MPAPYLLPKLDHPLVPNFKELAEELSALHKQQSEALQNATYIRMSAKEVEEYDQRGARIRAISRQLGW
jgi:phage regulator Rha-like protein